MATAQINGHTVAPHSQCQGGHQFKEDASHSDYILVQGSGRIKPEESGRLHSLGAEILQYIDNGTYICRYKPTDLQEIRALPFIKYANVYHGDLVIHPNLEQHLEEMLHLPSGSETQRETQLETVVCYVRIHHSDCRTRAIEDISRLASIDANRILIEGPSLLKARLPVNRLKAIAELDEVASIEADGEVGVALSQAPLVLMKPETIHVQGIGETCVDLEIQATDLDGRGQIVVVADTGLDQGQTMYLDPKSQDKVHPLFKGKVEGWSSFFQDDKAIDENGHGTAVAGCIVTPTFNSLDFKLPVSGTARGASVIVKKVFDSTGVMKDGDKFPWVDQLSSFLKNDPERDKPLPRITNLSLGDTQPGSISAYPGDAQVVDTLVFQNPDWVYVIAAGNHGLSGNDTQITGLAVAKNAICVGATENALPMTFPPDRKYNPIMGRPGNPNKIALFSSKGPTRLGRIKPDVVAPGQIIYSTKSTTPGLKMAPILPANPKDQQDSRFWFVEGTSFATPLVAGYCAVIRQIYCAKTGCYPSAAMVKALILHGAVDVQLAQNFPLKDPPEWPTASSSTQGFGRVNIPASLLPLIDQKKGENGEPVGNGGVFDSFSFPADAFAAKQEYDAMSPEEQKQFKDYENDFGLSINSDRWTLDLQVKDAKNTTITVTMVYTDPPGQNVVNILNLELRFTGEGAVESRDFRLGNPDVNNPLVVNESEARPRSRNNAQKVVWRNAPPGPFRVQVKLDHLEEAETPDKVQHFAVCWDILYEQNPREEKKGNE